MKKRQNFTKLSLLALVVFIGILWWICFELVSSRKSGEMPNIGKYSIGNVVSRSMEPILVVGDLVIVDTSKREPSVGEIAVYRYGNMLVIHRVMEVADGEYIFKGDNNENIDPLNVPKENIVGTVILGDIGTKASKIKEFLSFIIGALTIISIMLLVGEKAEKAKKLKENKVRAEEEKDSTK